jgi:hypothetical protein
MSAPDDTTAGDESGGWEPRVQTCRIVLWRGYATSAFYARAMDDLSGKPIGEPSSSFRSWRVAVPDSPEARLAHREIVYHLEAEGWIESGRGDEWYATEFARSILVPSPAPAVDPAPQEPEPELEPEPEPALSAPPALPEPATTTPAPAPALQAASSRRVDGWRIAAATGLVTAIALLGWVATHPSSVGAAGAPPQPAPTGATSTRI